MRAALGLLAWAAALLLVGCAPLAAAATAFNPEAVVRVWAAYDTPHGWRDMTTGSGFFIEHRGELYVVTAAHVARADAAWVVVVTDDWDKYPAHIAATDARRDLALLRVELSDGPAPLALVLAESWAAAPAGTGVAAVGYPSRNRPVRPGELLAVPEAALGMASALSVGRLRVAGTTVIENSRVWAGEPPAAVYMLTVELGVLLPGMSGGPVHVPGGRVAGIIFGDVGYVGDAAGYGAATAVDELWALLEGEGEGE